MKVGFVIIIIIHVQVFLDKTLLPAHKLQFHNLNTKCKSLQLLEVKFYDQLLDTPVFI